MSAVNDDMFDMLLAGIGLRSRIIDFSSEIGEFSQALVKKYETLCLPVSISRRVICAIPASPLAYELTKKVYELLGLDTDNIYRFTVYELLDAIESDSGVLDKDAVARVSAILNAAFTN